MFQIIEFLGILDNYKLEFSRVLISKSD